MSHQVPSGEWQVYLSRRQQLADEIEAQLRAHDRATDAELAAQLGVHPDDITSLGDQQRAAVAEALRRQVANTQFVRSAMGDTQLQRSQVGTSEYNDLLGIADFYGIADPEKYDVGTLMNLIEARRKGWNGEHAKDIDSIWGKIGSLGGAFLTGAGRGIVDTMQNIPFFGDAFAKTQAARESDRWLNKVAENFRAGVQGDMDVGVEIAGRLGEVVPAFVAYGTAWKLLGGLGYLAPVNMAKGTTIARTALSGAARAGQAVQNLSRAERVVRGAIRGGLAAEAVAGGGDSPVMERALNVILGAGGGAAFGVGGRTAGAVAGGFMGAAAGNVLGGDTPSELGGGAVGTLVGWLAPMMIGKAVRSFPRRPSRMPGPRTVEAGYDPAYNPQGPDYETVPLEIRGLLPSGETGVGTAPTGIEPITPRLPAPVRALPAPAPETPRTRVIRTPGELPSSGEVWPASPVSRRSQLFIDLESFHAKEDELVNNLIVSTQRGDVEQARLIFRELDDVGTQAGFTSGSLVEQLSVPEQKAALLEEIERNSNMIAKLEAAFETVKDMGPAKTDYLNYTIAGNKYYAEQLQRELRDLDRYGEIPPTSIESTPITPPTLLEGERTWYVNPAKAPEVLSRLARADIQFVAGYENGKVKLTFVSREAARMAATAYPNPQDFAEGLINYMAIVGTKKTAKGEEITFGAGTDPSIATKWEHNYGENMALIIMREGIQNAIDAMRVGPKGEIDPNGKILVEVDTKKNTWTFTDNGSGMTPKLVGTKWIDFYGSQKPGGASGGFGIGMTGPIASSEAYELTTVAYDPSKGKKIRTHVKSSGPEALAMKTKGLTEDVPDDTPTYTKLTITMPSERWMDWDAMRNWLSTYGLYSRKVPFEVVIDKLKYDVIGTDPATGAARKPSVLADLPTDVKTTMTAKGAEIDVYHGKKIESVRQVDYHILNNGVYQTTKTKYFNQKVDAPNIVIFDIRPTVGTESSDYPFTQARSEMKSPVVKALEGHLGSFEFGGGKKEVSKLEFVLRNPVPIAGTKMGIYTSDPGIDNDLLARVIGDYPALNFAPLAETVRNTGKLVWSLMTNTPWLKGIEEPEMGGLTVSGKALGINIPLRGMATIYDRIKQNAEWAGVSTVDFETPTEWLNAPNRILYNPWASLYEVLNYVPTFYGSEVNPYDPANFDLVASELADQAWNTTVHEMIHQKLSAQLFSGKYVGHDEEFTSPLTRILRYISRFGDEPIRQLIPIFRNLLDNGLIDQQRDLSQHWTQENLFKEIVGHDNILDAAITDLLQRGQSPAGVAGESTAPAGWNASFGIPGWNRVGMAAATGEVGPGLRAPDGRAVLQAQRSGGPQGSPGAGVPRADELQLSADEATQLTKQAAVLNTPALDEIGGHGKFTNVDVAQAQLASYPGQASVIRNVEDVNELFATAKERGLDTANWRVVPRVVLLPGASIKLRGDMTGEVFEGISADDAFFKAKEADVFKQAWGHEYWMGGHRASDMYPPVEEKTDVIVSPRPLTDTEVDTYKEYGILPGMRVITPGGVEAIAGETPWMIKYMDGSVDYTAWSNLLPGPSTQFVHDSPSAYKSFKSYAMDYMEGESKKANIPTPDWLSVETSSQFPWLMKSWMESRGITGKDEQGLLELYFDQQRVNDYREAAPDEDKADLENIINLAKGAIKGAYASGVWNGESIEEMAEARGFQYDPESRRLINLIDGTDVPVESDYHAYEFLRNYQAEMPDVTPTTGVPIEAIPTIAGGPTLSDGQMPTWPGAEEFYDSMERTADVLEDMSSDFLHGAKSGGGGQPPQGPPPGGTTLPSGGPQGQLPGRKQTLAEQFQRLERDDPRRFHIAIDKMNSILIQWFWGMRNATLGLEKTFVEQGITEGTLWRDLEGVELGLTKAHNATLPYFDEWRDIVKDFDRKHRRDGTVVHIEEIPNWNDKLRAMQAAGYSDKEMAAQARIRPFFDRMHGEAQQMLGKHINYIFDYIPMLRKYQSISKNPWIDFGKVIPDDLSWFALHARHYGIQARQLDISSLGSIYIRGLFHEMYIKDAWLNASQKWDKPGVPKLIRGEVHDWLEHVRTGINPNYDVFISGTRHMLNSMGVPVTDGDMAMLWGVSFANSYRGMMGWSPYHVFRDSIQPWLTGANIGMKYVRDSYIHWFMGGPQARQEMWDLALKHGWVEKGMTRIPIADVFSQPTYNERGQDVWEEKMIARRERAAEGVDWIYDHIIPDRFKFGITGSTADPMTPYTKLGEFNRIIAGYAGWLRAQEGIGLYRSRPFVTTQGERGYAVRRTAEQLMHDTGANYYPVPIRNLAKELIRNDDMEGLSGLLAREAASTQFRYGSKELPLQVRALGTIGRMGAMLGSFTNQFVGVIKDGLNPDNGGWQHAAAFAARYGIVQGAVALAAAYTGWKGLEKLFWHKSLTFAGGPPMQWGIDEIRAGVAMMKVFTGERPSPAETSAFSQIGIQNPFVPPWSRGLKTVEGIANSMQAPNPAEATARFLLTGEAGTFRDFRNYFDEDWQRRLEQQGTGGMPPDAVDVLRQRARSIREGAGYSQ